MCPIQSCARHVSDTYVYDTYMSDTYVRHMCPTHLSENITMCTGRSCYLGSVFHCTGCNYSYVTHCTECNCPDVPHCTGCNCFYVTHNWRPYWGKIVKNHACFKKIA